MEVLLIGCEYMPACMEGNSGAVIGNMVNGDVGYGRFLEGGEFVDNVVGSW